MDKRIEDAIASPNNTYKELMCILEILLRSRISSLPLPVLEDLSEALLDFTSMADL